MSELAARLQALLEEARANGELPALREALARTWRAAADEPGSRGEPLEVGGEAFPGRFGIVGASDAMRVVFEAIERFADAELPVLVRGETGTGKELVARALHAGSRRAPGPWVAENCAAVPATLLESELFGHRRGAFTDAVADRAGHFRSASGGTLFLDEIGEMPPELQSKLLRVLDQRVVRPVGADRPVPVDVRLVVATNRDLARGVAEGRFRQDLLYRINAVEIGLPPLRERNGDIELLARYFLARAGCATPPRPTPEALALLRACPWPGNVRQLQNEMERAAALATGRDLSPEDLSPELVRATRPGDRQEVDP